MKLKPPVGGSKSLLISESLTESFKPGVLDPAPGDRLSCKVQLQL